MNLRDRYDLRPWMAMKKEKGPEPETGDPLEGFRKYFNIDPGQKFTVSDYDDFPVLLSDEALANTRKVAQKYWNRILPALSKPSEVWCEINKEGAPLYNYLKAYEDGYFELRVEFGELKWWLLREDAEWAERQRTGMLIYSDEA